MNYEPIPDGTVGLGGGFIDGQSGHDRINNPRPKPGDYEKIGGLKKKICPTCGQVIGGGRDRQPPKPGFSPQPTIPDGTTGLGGPMYGGRSGHDRVNNPPSKFPIQPGFPDDKRFPFPGGQRPEIPGQPRPPKGTTGEYLGYVNGQLQTFPNEQAAQQAGATGIQPNYQYKPMTRRSGLAKKTYPLPYPKNYRR